MSSLSRASRALADELAELPIAVLEAIRPFPDRMPPTFAGLAELEAAVVEAMPAGADPCNAVLVHIGNDGLRPVGAVGMGKGPEGVAGVRSAHLPHAILPVFPPFYLLPVGLPHPLPSEEDLLACLPGEPSLWALQAHAGLHMALLPSPRQIVTGLGWSLRETTDPGTACLGSIRANGGGDDPSASGQVWIEQNATGDPANALAFMIAGWLTVPHTGCLDVRNVLEDLERAPDHHGPQVREAWDLHDAILLPGRVLAIEVRIRGLWRVRRDPQALATAAHSLASKLGIPEGTVRRRLQALLELPASVQLLPCA